MLSNKSQHFIKIFKKAQKKYNGSSKRLTAEGWNQPWQVLIATIMSAQSRDETTIPIAETLFKQYTSLESLNKANYNQVLKIFKSLNYNKTKAKNVIKASQYIIQNYNEKIPNTIEQLIQIPGVGRKTANLVLSEIHKQNTITVDTHVHRLSNVLQLVKTKTPKQTEQQLEKIAPKQYWSRINRIFVLWGKDIPGRNKEKLLNSLNQK